MKLPGVLVSCLLALAVVFSGCTAHESANIFAERPSLADVLERECTKETGSWELTPRSDGGSFVVTGCDQTDAGREVAPEHILIGVRTRFVSELPAADWTIHRDTGVLSLNPDAGVSVHVRVQPTPFMSSEANPSPPNPVTAEFNERRTALRDLAEQHRQSSSTVKLTVSETDVTDQGRRYFTVSTDRNHQYRWMLTQEHDGGVMTCRVTQMKDATKLDAAIQLCQSIGELEYDEWV